MASARVLASRPRFIASILLMVFLAIYLPDLGHGFIKDDFQLIAVSRSDDLGQLLDQFGRSVGFYRPIVLLSFAADYAIWGLNPLGYGLTNLMMSLACIAMLHRLARQLDLAPAAAILAAAVWALNLHAMNMALLWISGRTALLVTIFSLVTAVSLLRRQPAVAGAACLAALLCKEEAVAMPLLFTLVVSHHSSASTLTARASEGLRRCAALWMAVAFYAVLRTHSGAFGPTTAPAYYQLSFSPALILRNIAEYADRAGTTSAIVALALLAAARWRVPPLADAERRVVVFAGLWLVAGFAVTLFLPVRSSLYALLPSVGTALAVGALAAAVVRTEPVRFRTVAVGLALLSILLMPVYRSRNVPWVRLAELSSSVIDTLTRASAPVRPGRIVLVDDASRRLNLTASFGTLFPDAVRLTLGEAWTGEIVSPGTPVPPDARLVFRLVEGGLRSEGRVIAK